jgi:hypothetical protein
MPVSDGARRSSRTRCWGMTFPAPTCRGLIPYGIHDIGRNSGFVNIGTDHDTCVFAVTSIRGWRHEGRRLCSRAEVLLITTDRGRSNGWRLRLWKVELQKFADESGLTLSVCHFPSGTSKWNKVEHRCFPLSRRTSEVSRCGTTKRS